MKSLTLVCIACTVVAASQAMTTIVAPVAEISTTSPTTTTINPLLQRRIDAEISRLTRLLQRRIRNLQMGSGRLDRSIASLQRQLDFNNAVLAQLPELIKNIMINNPSQRLSPRTINNLMRGVQNAASAESNEESAEIEDRRRRAVFEVTSSVVIVEGTSAAPEPEVTPMATETTTEMTTTAATETEVTPMATETTTEMTTQEITTTAAPQPEVTSMATETTTEMTTQEVTTEMATTAAPEPEVTSMATETTTEMTTQGTTLPPFLVSRINSAISRIGRFFQRRIQRIQRSLFRLGGFRSVYSRLIDENTDALNNLPLLVRDLVTSPFQRRLRLSQVFRALRLRRANTTPSQSEVFLTARKRREAESAEVDDDLVGDMEDLDELEQEVHDALEEIEELDN